jgi:hypothetical protein
VEEHFLRVEYVAARLPEHHARPSENQVSL